MLKSRRLRRDRLRLARTSAYVGWRASIHQYTILGNSCYACGQDLLVQHALKENVMGHARYQTTKGIYAASPSGRFSAFDTSHVRSLFARTSHDGVIIIRFTM